jgi:NTP pyrophosphatase (non-canonical NTP hydrolase)
MTIDEIIQKLQVINDKLREKYPHLDHEAFVLMSSAKVSEEYGEFMDELLSSLGMQRRDKLENYDPDNLASEFADVFITLLLTGMASGIDVKKAITKRLDEQYLEWNK